MSTVLTIIAIVIVVFLVVKAVQSPHYVIARSVVINAPADKVFPYLNTRAIANSWNPFLKQDPAVKITLSGPGAGVGSKTAWEGNTRMGAGNAEVIESVPNDHILVKLDMQRPMACRQVASYWLEPAGNGTKVTWKVEGDNTFIPRVMCTFMNMDKMVGGAFLQGLTELKGMVEG